MIYDECDNEYVMICDDNIFDLINISHFIHIHIHIHINHHSLIDHHNHIYDE